MKSFVITFYRHGGKESPDLLIGTFGDPADGVEQKFGSMAELHHLLDEASASWKGGKRRSLSNPESSARRKNRKGCAPGGGLSA